MAWNMTREDYIDMKIQEAKEGAENEDYKNCRDI